MTLKDQLKSGALKAVLNGELKNIGSIQVLEINTKEKSIKAELVIDELLPTKFSVSTRYRKDGDSLILFDTQTSHRFIKAILQQQSDEDSELSYELPEEWMSHL